MNVELLQKVKERILAEPEAFDMDTWGYSYSPNVCGTTACIAGHAVFAHTGSMTKMDVEMKAKGYLELSEYEADRLFFLGSWPIKFEEAYNYAGDPKAAAQAAADRIDHFIATGE